jgi:hypothetical protein
MKTRASVPDLATEMMPLNVILSSYACLHRRLSANADAESLPTRCLGGACYASEPTEM